ncbi:MAG: MoaD/ThiS family protein [Kiloniellales bacterium]|nr:MoaD/ThiS family protein [Kiloniellales bacterium]
MQIGHNSQGAEIEIEVRLFNRVARYANGDGPRQRLSVAAGSTVGELADRLGIPHSELFLVLVNGRDITPGLVGDAVRAGYQVEQGDVVAFSGAVPYSYGYGAPVV